MKFQERYEDFLMHKGVIGMQWGRRKKRSTVSSVSSTRSGPVGRKKNVVSGTASGGYRRGSGLGTGPVGRKATLQVKQQNAKKETNAEYFKRIEEERKQTEKALRKLNNLTIAGNNASMKKAAANAWVDLYLASNKDMYAENIYDNPSGTEREEINKRYNQAAESLKAIIKAQKMDKDAQKNRRKKNFENNIMRKGNI